MNIKFKSILAKRRRDDYELDRFQKTGDNQIVIDNSFLSNTGERQLVRHRINYEIDQELQRKKVNTTQKVYEPKANRAFSLKLPQFKGIKIVQPIVPQHLFSMENQQYNNIFLTNVDSYESQENNKIIFQKLSPQTQFKRRIYDLQQLTQSCKLKKSPSRLITSQSYRPMSISNSKMKFQRSVSCDLQRLDLNILTKSFQE